MKQTNICRLSGDIINGDGDCSLLAAYRRAYGSGRLTRSKGRRPLALFLQSQRESGELSQCSKYDDSTITIVRVLLLLATFPPDLSQTHFC